MLVKVNQGKGQSYVNIEVTDIAQVCVARKGEEGYYVQRGAHSFVELKNGKQYLTSPDEAQRVVDFMRKLDDESFTSSRE